jgi:ribosomal protein S18 acetylase RimI-like enzyme
MDPTRPTSIAVRRAHLDDAAQIAELGSLVFSVTFGHSVEPHQLQAYLDESYSVTATAADISNPQKDMIVATKGEEGSIIAFALLTRGTSEPCVQHLQNAVELQRIYVHPGIHGKGVGKLLADKLENMARGQNFQYIWLGVWEENYQAMKAYEKWGYKKVGEHDFTIGQVVQTDYILLKEL